MLPEPIKEEILWEDAKARDKTRKRRREEKRKRMQKIKIGEWRSSHQFYFT